MPRIACNDTLRHLFLDGLAGVGIARIAAVKRKSGKGSCFQPETSSRIRDAETTPSYAVSRTTPERRVITKII
jgi:hypothetical protein